MASNGVEGESSPTSYRRAAQYLRMSTDRQKYSIHNQAEALQQYAVAHDMLIVRTYADEGISGLTLKSRPALTELITDVEQGRATFDVLLIYDVSRWGRFQDTDESAHYEYLCRKAGVRVIYCAELFENDQSPLGSILKSIKRVMAAEYSRELSNKVFRGQCTLAQKGYRQGGEVVLGLRRMAVDPTGKPLRRLKRGQRKALAEERVITVLGPPKEVERVRQVFDMFIGGASMGSISALMNRERVPRSRGGKWYGWEVRRLLENELYIGNYVYGMTQQRLQSPVSRTRPDTWIRAEGVGPAIIGQDTFQRAQEILAKKRGRWAAGRDVDEAEMVAELRNVVARNGDLQPHVLASGELRHDISTYRRRLGGLVAIRQALGLPLKQDYGFLALRHEKAALRADLIARTTAQLQALGFDIQQTGRWTFQLDGKTTLSVHVLLQTKRPTTTWHLRADEIQIGDYALLALLDREQALRQLLLVPRPAIGSRSWSFDLTRFAMFEISGVEHIRRSQLQARARPEQEESFPAHRTRTTV
jgi:DNA invertase Pin-like site-specific DNA recombinase